MDSRLIEHWQEEIESIRGKSRIQFDARSENVDFQSQDIQA
jgi:hypothetical protein